MKRVIKKYNNRKLYDTEQSRYVSLPEVAEMIRSGIDVVVVDQKTKVDLTGPTLAQALLGNEKDFYAPAVIDKLKEILQVGGLHEYAKRN